MLVSEGVYDMDILYTCMHTYRVITLLIRVITPSFAGWGPFCRFPFVGFAGVSSFANLEVSRFGKPKPKACPGYLGDWDDLLSFI